MYYRINVAKRMGKDWTGKNDRYIHFFATAPESILDMETLKIVLQEILNKFQSPEYEVTVDKCDNCYSSMNIKKIIK